MPPIADKIDPIWWRWTTTTANRCSALYLRWLSFLHTRPHWRL